MKMKSNNLFTLAALIACCLLYFARAASAADLNESLNGLADTDFEKKVTAVERLASTGDPRVAKVLKALSEGSLYYRKAEKEVVIALTSGGRYLLRNPVSDQELGEADGADLQKITVNNRLRRVIRTALGGLTLLSADRAARAKAVEDVLKASDPAMLPILRQAVEREEDTGLKDRMRLAEAALELFAPVGEEVKMKAIDSLTKHPSQEVRSLLGRFMAEQAASSPALARAAEQATSQVDRTLRFWELIGHFYRGLSLGSVLLLAALGLSITFGVMGVINMAHGEMVMLGAYAAYLVQEAFRAYLPQAVDYAILVSVPAAFLMAGAAGMAMERAIIRFLYGRPLETLLATWGISLLLQQSVRSVFGPTNREMLAPSWMNGLISFSSGLALTYNRLWIILFSLAVVGGIAWVLRRTTFGLQMRAVTQNRSMAGAMGVRTGALDALTFGFGSGLAGMAGVALSQIDNVSPNLGQSYIIDSFMVVVFGGVGNLWGTVVGAFSLGILNKYMEPLSGAVLGKILVLVGIILFIQKRPRGLFALRGRAVEN